MKCILVLLATSIALATGLAPRAPYAAASGSSSPNAALTLPPQFEGESLGAFLDRIFPDETEHSSNDTDLTGSVNKRTIAKVDGTGPYTNAYGLHQSCWDDETSSGTTTYNISADFSNCGTGLTLATDIGVYTFTNGTTTDNTTLRDMTADMYSLRHSRQSPNPNYANHTAVVSQLAMEEANQPLNNGLICRNTSDAAKTEDIAHDELRHLLMNVHSYWTAVMLSAAGGAIAGASAAAILDYAFNGNVTTENVVQTAIVIGSVVLLGGILTRCDQRGTFDGAESITASVRDLVPQGREAIVQNIYVGWARRQISRIVRQQVQEALSEAGVGSGVGVGSVGTPRSPDSLPSLYDSPNSESSYDTCLSELEAAEASSALGEMTDVTLDLEPIQEVFEQLGPRDEQGRCGSP